MTFPYTIDAFTTKAAGQLIRSAHPNEVQAAITRTQTELVRTYRPDLKPAVPTTVDDEFEAATINPAWTATNCADGAVDMLDTAPAAGVYDLSTFTGILALQAARDDDSAAGPEAAAAFIRKSITLAANCKVVAKVSVSGARPENNYIQAGIMLSGANGFNDNDLLALVVQPRFDTGVYFSLVAGLVSVGGAPMGLSQVSGSPDVYLMITKTDNNYSLFVSNNGLNWAALADGSTPAETVITNATALTRLTVYAYWAPVSTEVNLPAPIAGFDFVRYFPNNTPTVNA